MIYFTSDLHFGDQYSLKFFDRPFGSVEEMDEAMIYMFNDTVGPDDTVFILGDFTANGTREECEKYLSKLECKHVHLIRGNHDLNLSESDDKPSPFETERDYYEIDTRTRMFCLSHYPFQYWNGQDLGSFMLHGHLHSSRRANDINNWHRIFRYDVGVEANNYRPVSINEIMDFF